MYVCSVASRMNVAIKLLTDYNAGDKESNKDEAVKEQDDNLL
jgi:hypothetical protein